MAIDNLFEPFNRKRSFEHISDVIKTSILDGTLKPGDKLPSEPEIASQFHVGRQTIRDAMRVLEQSGFIAVERGAKGGPLVKDTILSKISGLFVDALKMKMSSAQEFTVARTELENIIFRYALKNLDGSDIKKLAENVHKAEKKLDSGAASWEDNVEFHRILAKASKNYLFVIVMEAICAIQADFIIGAPRESTMERTHATAQEHQEILAAILAGRNEEAQALFEKHLIEVPTKYFQTLGKKVTSQSRKKMKPELPKQGR
jgi:GntR family transcriptional regulator, transcriptional repressor for pyruvate dehydrogenase complex